MGVRGCFERMRRITPPPLSLDEWTTIYGATWHQLHANILPRYPEAVIEAARVKADAAPLYLPPHESHPGPVR